MTSLPSSPPIGALCREPAGAVKGAQRPVCGRTLDGAEDSRILALAGWSASPLPTQTAVTFTLNQYTPFMMLYFVAGTIVFTWIYIHTGGSLLLVVLAQMGAYLTNPSPAALPGQTSPLAINTVAYVVVAGALVALDRKAWRSPPTPADRADGARSPGLRC